MECYNFQNYWRSYEMEGLFLLGIIWWIAMATFGARLAGEKGYAPLAWGVTCLLFGIVAFIAIAAMPRTIEERRSDMDYLARRLRESLAKPDPPQAP
jgi:hypothetical protein